MMAFKDLIKRYKQSGTVSDLTRFALSDKAILLQFALASVIVLTDYQINGVAIFGFIGVGMLILTSSILTLLAPILFASVFATALYDSAEKFTSFIIPEAVIIILSLVFHFAVYCRRPRIGRSFKGLLAVGIATLLGGVGTISIGEYFAPSTLYYTVFLGFGMAGIYIALSCLSIEKEDLDVFERFAFIMYMTGIFACFNVLSYYLDSFREIMASPRILDFQASNNLATFIMISLPFPCLFALKAKGIKRSIHLFSFAAMYIFLILTGSGGGALMGSIQIVFIGLYLGVYITGSKKAAVISIAAALLTSILALIFYLTQSGLSSVSELFYSNNMRISLFKRSLSDFLDNPVFGKGIGYLGNTDIYSPKSGAMNWYHMMLPQIIGSMGSLGILCYGYQLIIRVKLVFSNIDPYSLCLALSYLGLFLMSQVNPGEFCPIPYSLIAVITFKIIEDHKEYKNAHPYLSKS